MKIIIPMAGMGKRMRPHTLTIPKPLIPIAGKPIVQRLVEEIGSATSEKIDEIAFIVGDFGKEVEENLKEIAKQAGAKSSIYHQDEPLGTAHAILCAKESLDGKIIVAFADTLFKAGITIDTLADANIWVSKVENPTLFGVVTVNENDIVTGFVEKPKTYVSDLAIIGIYYFKDGENLKNELQFLIDNKIIVNKEYQLTDALENMKKKGIQFKTERIQEWLDCGNKNATVYTNQRILEHCKNESLISTSAEINDSILISPCYVGDNVLIKNSVIGPHVSVGNNTRINNSLIKNSIIQTNTVIEFLNIENSMIGNYVEIKGDVVEVSIGDYAVISK